ncbi:MAG: hypothetical protein WAU38_01180 [Ignavibacteria bacterium]
MAHLKLQKRKIWKRKVIPVYLGISGMERWVLGKGINLEKVIKNFNEE